MEAPKLNWILFGVVMLTLSTAFYIIISSSVLTAKIQPWYWAVVMILFITLFFEFGITSIRRGLNIHAEAIKTSDYGLWTTLAQVFLNVETTKLVIAIIISIVFIGASIVIAIIQLKRNPIRWEIIFWIPFIVLVVYLLLRTYIVASLAWVGRKFTKQWRKIMPSYIVYSDGVIIDPAIVGLDYKITLRFSELDEIREMTYWEAEAYKEKIGPNIPIGFELVQDLYKMAKAKTRPKVYFFTQGAGKTVLLKGKRIHYLITFGVDSASDLIHAFNEYKRKH